MALVADSLTLHNIIIGVTNGIRTVWFVSRSGTVKKFYIKNKMDLQYGARNHIFLVEIHNLNTLKTHSEAWFGGDVKGTLTGGSGMMYDHYYGSGHFFHNPMAVFKYLQLRIDTKSKTIVSTAKSLINKFPEYIL